MERYRTTIILFVVLLVLGGAAIILNRNGPTNTAGVPTVTPVVFVWQESNPVIAMDVVSGTGKVSLTKNLSTTVWMLTAPIQFEADPAVGDVASSLQNLAATSIVTNTSNLAQFGLDKSSFTVTSTFSDTKRTKRVLLIGGPTFSGDSYYVKPQDANKVYVVSNTTLEPIRTWLTTPPKLQPTATPLPITVVPTSTLTTAGTVTPSSAIQVPTFGASLPVTGTSKITGTTTLTVTSPSGANPTTPLASPPVAKPSATP
ncbi:MAG: DUF4340 domain-containing protein [Chloroflexi bacterium]|nr:DUF4340 domain-containing protein [Chloroflexota bacterium]